MFLWKYESIQSATFINQASYQLQKCLNDWSDTKPPMRNRGQNRPYRGLCVSILLGPIALLCRDHPIAHHSSYLRQVVTEFTIIFSLLLLNILWGIYLKFEFFNYKNVNNSKKETHINILCDLTSLYNYQNIYNLMTKNFKCYFVTQSIHWTQATWGTRRCLLTQSH